VYPGQQNPNYKTVQLSNDCSADGRPTISGRVCLPPTVSNFRAVGAGGRTFRPGAAKRLPFTLTDGRAVLLIVIIVSFYFFSRFRPPEPEVLHHNTTRIFIPLIALFFFRFPRTQRQRKVITTNNKQHRQQHRRRRRLRDGKKIRNRRTDM